MQKLWPVLLILVGILFWWGINNSGDTTLPSALIGKPAPEFTRDVLPMYRSEWKASQSLANFTGKPVVLNFWASWCPPCRDEAPLLEGFWQKYRSQLMVLGIAVKDAPKDSENFARQYGMTFPSLIDLEGRLMIEYGVYGQPETFVIDKNGIVLLRHVGPLVEADLPGILSMLGIQP